MVHHGLIVRQCVEGLITVSGTIDIETELMNLKVVL